MLGGMRPYGNAAQLEQRRRQAVRLLRAGKGVSEVARVIASAKSSVSRWWAEYRQRGLRSLRPKPVPGRPLKLSPSQRAQLLRLLARGAVAAGYSTDLWTTQRICDFIRQHFGVRYHRDYIGPLLRDLGWSWQKPEGRALQRDEEAIERWKKSTWPHIKNAQRRGAHLAFLDESGFLLIPTVRKTWAPVGHTPILRHSFRRDRISTISSLTVIAAKLTE